MAQGRLGAAVRNSDERGLTEKEIKALLNAGGGRSGGGYGWPGSGDTTDQNFELKKLAMSLGDPGVMSKMFLSNRSPGESMYDRENRREMRAALDESGSRAAIAQNLQNALLREQVRSAQKANNKRRSVGAGLGGRGTGGASLAREDQMFGRELRRQKESGRIDLDLENERGDAEAEREARLQERLLQLKMDSIRQLMQSLGGRGRSQSEDTATSTVQYENIGGRPVAMPVNSRGRNVTRTSGIDPADVLRMF